MQISTLFSSLTLLEQPPQKQISVQIAFEPIEPEDVIRNLSTIVGPVDVYCWYEGTQGLPTSGALFMKESIFEPLFALKQDIELCLYSLKGWDFKITDRTTKIGEAINRIETVAIKCFYSFSFFQYCKDPSAHSRVFDYISGELPRKEWLFDISRPHRASGKSMASLFNDEYSLFECIKEVDCSLGYSAMQYVEGYYLIQESIKKALLKDQRKIEIAFVLPNDESKYYLDFPRDIERMLEIDFGNALS